MLGYKVKDIDRMKISINAACFALPPQNEDLKLRLLEIDELLTGLIEEGHV
jgi:hypothetical protein